LIYEIIGADIDPILGLTSNAARIISVMRTKGMRRIHKPKLFLEFQGTYGKRKAQDMIESGVEELIKKKIITGDSLQDFYVELL